MGIDHDSAQVRVPPPLILLFFILVGAGVHWIYPVHFVPEDWRMVLSVSFIVLGLSVIFHCAWIFKRAGTDIKPWKTTTKIVTTGIYQLSRNPIYCAFIMIGLGVAIAVNSLWIVLLQAPLAIVLNKYVIQREEKYLEQKFGDEYRAYRERVRRWI